MPTDPTRDEMLAHLTDTMPEADEFDREEAVYWFACWHHSGQGSALYSALSLSPFSPGPIATAPERDSMADLCLDELEAHWPD